MRRQSLLTLSLLAIAATASAQQPAPAPAPRPAAAAPAPATARPVATPAARPGPAAPQLTPEQVALVQKQNADISQFAKQVAEMVDANKTGELWDQASSVAKKTVARPAFVAQIAGDRKTLGKVQNRGAASVTRSQFPAGAQVPEGNYLNVTFPTKFENTANPVRELVSFRLDEDKVWRVSGYTLR